MFAAAVAAACLGGLAVAQTAARPTAAPTVAPSAGTPPGLVAAVATGNPENGRKLIQRYCAGCHGPTGRGAQAPSFVGQSWRHGGRDAQIALSIRRGYPDLGMPAFGDVLTPAQVNDIIAFIRKYPILSNTAKGPGGAMIPPDPLPTGIVRTSQESFKVEVLARIDRPYAFAFLPDGRILVTQTDGALRVVDRGRLVEQPIAGTPSGAAPEEGARPRRMLDVALHPDYAQNGWIYLSWAEQAPGISGVEGLRVVLSRGRLRDGRWVDNQNLIRSPSQFIGSARIAFDGKGHVFFSVVHREFEPTTGGKPSPAQDLSNPTGKILRANDDGSTPADNPFVRQKDAHPLVWSYGHRSPMGLAFDLKGRLWESEDGPRGGDELNLIKPGANYGWPVITWGHRYDEKPVAAHPEEEGMEQPVINWSPAMAVSGIDFYRGTAFRHWQGDLILSTLKQRSLYRVVLDEQGRAVLQETLLYNVARFRDVRSGPDGFIYALTEVGDLMRLMPA